MLASIGRNKMKASDMEPDYVNEVSNEVMAIFKKYGIEHGGIFYTYTGDAGKNNSIAVIELDEDGKHEWVSKMNELIRQKAKTYFNLDEKGDPKLKLERVESI
jgi:mevalonate pyrophosphate decarboxylase